MKCADCKLHHLPVCLGERDPEQCRWATSSHVAEASKTLSSIEFGWPSPAASATLVDTDPRASLVAPTGCTDLERPWEGRQGPSSATTVTIPVCGGIELLEASVPLWRAQVGSPRILVVDTGSVAGDRARLERLRAEDLEIHYLRAHGWRHPSEPVAAACDLAMDLCRTEWLFFSHSDVFPVRRDLVERFKAKCSPTTPAIGYGMTPRSASEIARLTGSTAETIRKQPGLSTEEWEWMVGHSALVTHVPTIRRLGVRWGFGWGDDAGVLPAGETYRDTETAFNWGLRRAGVAPILVGDREQNYQRNTNDDFDHVRSYPSRRLYPGVGSHAYQAGADEWMRNALAAAKARAEAWAAKPRNVDKGCATCHGGTA